MAPRSSSEFRLWSSSILFTWSSFGLAPALDWFNTSIAHSSSITLAHDLTYINQSGTDCTIELGHHLCLACVVWSVLQAFDALKKIAFSLKNVLFCDFVSHFTIFSTGASFVKVTFARKLPPLMMRASWQTSSNKNFLYMSLHAICQFSKHNVEIHSTYGERQLTFFTGAPSIATLMRVWLSEQQPTLFVWIHVSKN